MTGWIPDLVNALGPIGIAVLMFLENVFPPIPSELVMPLAGYVAAQGEMSLVGAIVAGTVGSVAGALMWYGIAAWVGTARLQRWAERHGRWLTLHPEEIRRLDRWFDRHANGLVLFGRLIPGIRTFVSLPAGAFGMPLLRFTLLTTVGSLGWNVLLTLAGYWLRDRYTAIGGYVEPVSLTILAAAVALYVYRVVTFDPERAR